MEGAPRGVIGLLGERYGWIPDRYDTPSPGAFDWVLDSKPREYSIAELEILNHWVGRLDLTEEDTVSAWETRIKGHAARRGRRRVIILVAAVGPSRRSHKPHRAGDDLITSRTLGSGCPCPGGHMVTTCGHMPAPRRGTATRHEGRLHTLAQQLLALLARGIPPTRRSIDR